MANGSVLDKARAISDILRRFEKLDSGDTLELLTWKKDRSLLLIKQEDGEVAVHERGFVDAEYRVALSRLKKLLKVLLKREFPRSHKIRLRVRPGSGELPG